MNFSPAEETPRPTASSSAPDSSRSSASTRPTTAPPPASPDPRKPVSPPKQSPAFGPPDTTSTATRNPTPTRYGQLPAAERPIAHLAERIREATTTDEAADALTELTAAHDGILAGLGEILTATAEFHEGLGDATDPHTARRLRYLADEYLHIIRTDLTHTRNDLADRHAPHPGRSVCAEEVPATERERSAVCACPPPPRTMPAPPPPVAAGLRR
ncbi:hypothetical protein OIC43_09510 [Streptomyces sp. NBC_00825]|uniref:hypothetical protein n=1 Tax=unclassified Streptomyces TaxID=2593676 RepID=UPI002ED31B3E|nr:hypothetical protein OG832_34185 [Streptomyces sp. NBC_00826]WTH89259.1 hypothetical protein OIC43_09510 [Streptomyces sp. NBC_00825]WTH97984.1 hypothetical protein OHA23_09495 [Streptomyces sp. NBC_00822]